MTTLKDLIQKCTPLSDVVAVRRSGQNAYAKNTEGDIIALSIIKSDPISLVLGEDAQALIYLNLSGIISLKHVKFEKALPKLTHLYLDGCDLEEIIFPKSFEQLQQIYVQNQKNKLKRIVFKDDCPSLQLLDVCDNGLTEFALPKGFAQLQYVYLNDNTQLVEFTPPDLPSLNTLSIKNTRLRNLPANLILSDSLKTLYANGNAPKNIPKVFLGMTNRWGSSQNVIKDAQTWFKELRDYTSDKNKIVKLMLTGNGNAGKSSVLCALKNGKCEHKHDSTHGIQIDVVKDDAIEYNVWDFGGQEVYHGTHRLFMESEALQVILFDPETEDLAKQGIRKKDRVSKDEVLNHPIEYWYETVKELSPDSTFFIVQNKKDLPFKEDSTIREYALGKPKTNFVHVSATTGLDIDELAFKLKKGAKELPDFEMSMPQSWLIVRDFFIENLKKEKDSQKIITKEAFKDLCIESKVRDNTMGLLFKYLHHNGFLYYHPNLGDNIIADQRWALDAIYKPLDRQAAHYEECKEDLKGKIRVRRLFKIFGNEYTTDEKWLFLDFMKSCGLCFQLNDKPHQESKHTSDVYVFPEFLPSEKPKSVESDWHKAQKIHVLRYNMPWLNYTVIQSFISALGRKTATDNIWRNGIHVSTPEGWFKVELDYEEKAIILSIEQTAINRWLEPILEELKVSREKSGWEISTDGKPFKSFSLEQWKQKDKDKPNIEHLEREIEKETKPITKKLDDVIQEYHCKVILFLAANPTAKQLSFGNEHTHISVKLSEKSIKGKFELIPKLGTTVDIMIEAINELRPNIIHFVGHGKDVNPDTGKGGGIILHRSDYQDEKVLDAEALGKMFKRIKKKHPQLEIILLNACFSQPQAQAISCHGIYAIGSSDEIDSIPARVFASGFYKEYALTNDIFDAVDAGLTQGLSEDNNIEDLIHLYYNGESITI